MCDFSRRYGFLVNYRRDKLKTQILKPTISCYIYTVALKGHPVYLNCFIRRSFNRRFDARKRRFDACNRRIDTRNRRFDARSIVDLTLVTVDLTLVQSSIRRSCNRRFDVYKTSILFDAQGFQIS